MKARSFFKLCGTVCAVCCGAFMLPALGMDKADAQQLDVLHWWTSAGERKAAEQLVEGFAARGLRWHDAAIDGGGGIAAVKVLKSRVLMGDPPDVAQLIGTTLQEWARADLVFDLTATAKRLRWQHTLHPLAMEVVSHQGRVIAAPLGIHRINTLLYNRKLFAKAGLTPPRNWAEFDAAAATFARLGIQPLAWSDEPWQLATVFEAVLLSEAGADAYAELITKRNSAAWLGSSVSRALARMQALRAISAPGFAESPWTDGARKLHEGRAAMLIMGDWAGGELLAWGADPQRDFGCTSVPSTQGMHLYSVDTLAMLVNNRHGTAKLEKAAEAIVNTTTQKSYNQAKGSIPVLQDTKPESLNACARDSWDNFAPQSTRHLPSLAHRMAADDATKDAVAQILWRFLSQSGMSNSQAQQRLATVIRKPVP